MIAKSFEAKFLFKVMGSVVGGFSIIIAAVSLILSREEVLHYYEAVFLFISTNKALVKTFIAAGAIELIFIAGVITFISIYASHKLAGPVYRLEKILGMFGDGDLRQRVRFRKYDPIKGVEESFNRSVEGLGEKLRAVEGACEEADRAREGIDGSEESVERFRKKVSILEREIEKFKV